MRVLIPLDGSEFSETVLVAVAPLVRSMGADVVLLRVLDPRAAHETAVGHVFRDPDDETRELPTWGVPVEPVRRFVEDRGQALARARRSSEEHLRELAVERLPGVDVEVVVEWSGDAAEAIVGAVLSQKADVVAMATHGRTGLSRALLGSVAGATVRNATVPVLLVNRHVKA